MVNFNKCFLQMTITVQQVPFWPQVYFNQGSQSWYQILYWYHPSIGM